MLDIYWGCLIGGVVFAAVTFVLGDLIGHVFHGLFDALAVESPAFWHPMVLVGGITVFGGTGVMLQEYSALPALVVLFCSVVIAFLAGCLVYLFYVKPMRGAENSTGFSIHDLVGKIGEVTVPLPTKGYGEILVKIGAGHTNQIASSFEKEEIAAGTKVVVVEVQDSTLRVVRFEEKESKGEITNA